MGKNVGDMLKLAEIVSEFVDLVEFRFDYLSTLNDLCLDLFVQYPCIVTVRGVDDGGMYNGDLNLKLKVYRDAIEVGLPYIDVELGLDEYIVDLVNFRDDIGSRTKIIVSYHNFDLTPEYCVMEDIVEKELACGDLAKIATMVNDKKDVLDILRLVSQFDGKLIGIGMGSKGKITRILNLYFGSPMTFVSVCGMSSAPGQLDLNEFFSLVRHLQSIGLNIY